MTCSDQLHCDNFDRLVGSISAKRPTATCSPEHTLLEASKLLQSAGRTAALIVDNERSVLGVLTENDMLLAFIDGVSSTCTVSQWLHGGEARLPSFLVSPLTMRPDALLVDAAFRMATMVKGDFACHHLLVCDAAGDSSEATLLSALDIARGMLVTSSLEICKEAPEAAQQQVEKAMKLRSDVPSCTLADSLGDAFDALHSAKQNCVLAIPSAGEGDAELENAVVGGAVTPADALRAISEDVNCRSVSVAKWLHRSGISPEHRFVCSNASLAEAAALMSKGGLHHLLVEEPARSKIVGVLSALDIVRAIAGQKS